jgi:phage terminase large subunit-like protein
MRTIRPSGVPSLRPTAAPTADGVRLRSSSSLGRNPVAVARRVPADDRVKGSHIIVVSEWCDETLGPGTFSRLTKDCWGVVVPVGWYEVETLFDVYAEISRRTNRTVGDIACEIASLNAERDLTTIYRIFLRMAQPQRVLSYGARLWRTYASFGETRIIKNDTGVYVGEASGFTDRQIEWASGCWNGFVPTAIRVSGGKNIRASVEKKVDDSGLWSLTFTAKYSS